MSNVTIDSPRVRFNWGFWDGYNDQQKGRAPLWARDEDHHDQVYVAGYRAGRRDYQDRGAGQTSSDGAWAEYRRR